MKTEKQKMLAGEPYQARDKELFNERTHCRLTIQKLNNSLSNSDEWKNAIAELITNSKGNTYIEPPFFAITVAILV